ncbi:hypothetical protein [Paraflavitalea speifideaquila]|uniref:hypothetical protein n=1 Tax=Paraflavitalea speifideaquila TaxID=3076558 RepID=UPI0028ECA332|nr:hypothetical protein [Paraflavitalea speifideiaquila]
MKTAIKYFFLILVPVLATTSCKKDTNDDTTPGDTPGGGKPPVENKYNNMLEVKAPVQKVLQSMSITI